MIGSNDGNDDYVPTQILVPQMVTTIRETNARIDEVIRFIKDKDLPEVLKEKYKHKLSLLIDTKYKIIYAIMDLNYDIKECAYYNDELKELLGSEFFSRIRR